MLIASAAGHETLIPQAIFIVSLNLQFNPIKMNLLAALRWNTVFFFFILSDQPENIMERSMKAFPVVDFKDEN